MSIYRAPLTGYSLDKFTTCHIDCLHKSFDAFDNDGSGGISTDELNSHINDNEVCTCTGTCAQGKDKCQENLMSEFDKNHNLEIEYSEITGTLRTDNTFVAARIEGALGCPDGFWAVANGRLCMSKKLHPTNTMWDAIETCSKTEPGCRVCHHADYIQACAPVASSEVIHTCSLKTEEVCGPQNPCSAKNDECLPNPYHGRGENSYGWYGEHAPSMTLSNLQVQITDHYLTWTIGQCLKSDKEANSGAGSAHYDLYAHYRCCF